jgi:mercuric ion transport protein
VKTPTPESTSIAAGIAAALGASSCCVLPLVLVAIGLGGAWAAQLRELERFFPVFVAFALASFGFAFYRLYLKPVDCAPDGVCASPQVRRRQRVAFWVTLVVAHALVLSPYYAAYLFS